MQLVVHLILTTLLEGRLKEEIAADKLGGAAVFSMADGMQATVWLPDPNRRLYFELPAGQTPRGTLLLVVAWMVGLMLAPLGGLVTGDWLRWGTAYLLCAVQVAWFSRLAGAFRWFTAVLYPVPLIFFFVVFAWSMLRSGKRVQWKGREILAD